MKCKSCDSIKIYERGLCRSCRADYAYSIYRRNLESRQRKNNKPISSEGTRWSKLERKNLKAMIKFTLLENSHLKIRAAKVEFIFEIPRSLANKILQELMAANKIVKKGSGTQTHYEVVND